MSSPSDLYDLQKSLHNWAPRNTSQNYSSLSTSFGTADRANTTSRLLTHANRLVIATEQFAASGAGVKQTVKHTATTLQEFLLLETLLQHQLLATGKLSRGLRVGRGTKVLDGCLGHIFLLTDLCSLKMDNDLVR